MTSETTNARILHSTLDKLKILKQAYGFKSLFEAAEYAVQQTLTNQATQALLEKSRLVEELAQQRQMLRELAA